MNLTSSSAELHGSLKNMRALWDETKEYWNDVVSREFDQQRWQPLQANIMGALRAMERLSPVLDRLQRDCG